MKNQVYNPYLPNWEYIPDGEPRVFNDRLYIFGSHDRFNGADYCENDYVSWSAPVDDLSDWRYEGVILRKNQTPWNVKNEQYFAPDVVQGSDGRYYLYYFVANSCKISVAVCDEPAGKYEYLGGVRMPDGHAYGSLQDEWFTFDPAVLVDDDGKIWLYTGSGQPLNEKYGHPLKGCFVVQLDTDMLTIISEPKVVLPANWSRKNPGFFEGASIRHIGAWYYLVYPTSDMTGLNYAISRYPDRDFEHKGRIHSSSDIGYENRGVMDCLYPIGNNHGGLACIKGQWYVFDHRMTNNTFFSRQGVAEPISIKADGTIDMVESTSCGLNGGTLAGIGSYPAYICCNLVGKGLLGKHMPMNGPYVTQEGDDFDPDTMSIETAPISYIDGITNGSQIGFKYFDMTSTTAVRLKVQNANGKLQILDDIDGKPVAEVTAKVDESWQEVKVEFDPQVVAARTKYSLKKCPLFIRYKGKGKMKLRSFTLS